MRKSELRAGYLGECMVMLQELDAVMSVLERRRQSLKRRITELEDLPPLRGGEDGIGVYGEMNLGVSILAEDSGENT